MENILLSFPRSGNHLVRFFIELITELPTYGCIGNKEDKEIYKNIFPEKIPFNIPKKNHLIKKIVMLSIILRQKKMFAQIN